MPCIYFAHESPLLHRSPSSDLDLCLQIPQSAADFTKENGVAAMTELAEKFTEAGMVNVDTVRLTARIPIVKFNFPYNQDGNNILVECDLSLQNPLACLNTALLNTYSKISPDTCILASIIKRWAKMRDINNPAMHTLSSYGYVLMLLYYLTSSEPSNNGFVLDPGNGTGRNPPILVNLQRVDPSWAQNPVGPYREIVTKPHNQYCIHQHPTEPNYLVNTYFYRSGLDSLEQYHTNKSKCGPCLGVLLASFFRFFAYEFDYKKFAVSLDTKNGEFKEKEIKAEEDGWSLYKPGLAIEDPFEHFYDVAHVVKTSNFHHIQQEFALAYSKIVSAACGQRGFVSGRDLIDLICEPIVKRDD
jgi:DNA polymerase sigma